MYPGIDAARPRPTSRRPATPSATPISSDRIDEGQLKGGYDFDGSFIDSIDFGVSYTDNKVRSAYGFIQNDTWGGTGPASEIPDDIFTLETLPDKFPGMSGHNDPGMIQQFYRFDFERMVDLIDGLYGPARIRAANATGEAAWHNSTTDRRITEKTLAPYIQSTTRSTCSSARPHLRAGLRYEETKIDSSALVPVPIGHAMGRRQRIQSDLVGPERLHDAQGRLRRLAAGDRLRHRADQRREAARLVQPHDHARRLRQPAGRPDARPAVPRRRRHRRQGNPGLLPYKSKNIDLSAEWYYGPSSYVSVGYFHKDVATSSPTTRVDQTAFELTNPATARATTRRWRRSGRVRRRRNPRVDRRQLSEYRHLFAGGAPGQRASAHHPRLADDPLLNFKITTPTNSDQTAKLSGWEFAVQHSFWDTGFGVILNYTIVNGSATYDNTLPCDRHAVRAHRPQRQRQCGAVLRQERHPGPRRLQLARKFLAGNGPNPFYVEAYGQLDGSASYEFIEGLTGFVEAINLTGSRPPRPHAPRPQRDFASPGYAATRRACASPSLRAPPPPAPPPPPPPPPPATQTCADGSESWRPTPARRRGSTAPAPPAQNAAEV